MLEGIERALGDVAGSLRDADSDARRRELLFDPHRRDRDPVPAERRGSRAIYPGASPEYAAHLAKGGTLDDFPGRKTGVYSTTGPAGTIGDRPRGAEFLRDVRAARLGDHRAHDRIAKAWQEGSDAAGGFLVQEEQLPGYFAARRASSPLRERCTQYDVSADTVWVVTEGNTVSVQHTAESATKINTTGTVGRKVSTVHKVAGTSTVSDELIADSTGTVEELLSRQFAAQIGITVDTAIMSGTGTGQPTGIRNAAGVTATAVDGQGGYQLNNSILKAIGRLRQAFYDADAIVMHPRDVVKFELAQATDNTYLFPEGILERYRPAEVIVDANIPTNLGAGANESVMIVGNFKAGGAFFQRQPLTLDASSDAGFTSDETVFRAVERYGFAVLDPSAFQVLSGILP